MSAPRYVVQQTVADVVTSWFPLEQERIDVWTVTRVDGANMARHIGRYKTEEAANKVAEALTGWSSMEAPQ